MPKAEAKSIAKGKARGTRKDNVPSEDSDSSVEVAPVPRPGAVKEKPPRGKAQTEVKTALKEDKVVRKTSSRKMDKKDEDKAPFKRTSRSRSNPRQVKA